MSRRQDIFDRIPAFHIHEFYLIFFRERRIEAEKAAERQKIEQERERRKQHEIELELERQREMERQRRKETERHMMEQKRDQERLMRESAGINTASSAGINSMIDRHFSQSLGGQTKKVGVMEANMVLVSNQF